jgi:signal peptidase
MFKGKSVQKEDKKKSSISKGIRFFLGVALVLGLGYLIFNHVPFIAKYDYYVIQTGSMEPIIMERDVVIIDQSTAVEDIKEKQIIAFYADFNEDGVDEIVVHYLSRVIEEDGVITYKTVPEVSDKEDPWTLTEDDIIGTHAYTIENIGSFLMFAQSNIGKVVLIADLLIIYLLMELFSDSEKKNKKQKKDLEKASI